MNTAAVFILAFVVGWLAYDVATSTKNKDIEYLINAKIEEAKSQKIECEKSVDECVMVFDFVPVKK